MLKKTIFVYLKFNENNDLRNKIIKKTVLATMKKQENDEKNVKKKINAC